MRPTFTNLLELTAKARSNRMTRTRKAWRLLIGVAVLVLASIAAPAAQAAQSPDHLADQGWTCFTPPPRPDLVACYNPGQGRPLPGNPDPAPAYSVKTFSAASGEFLSTAHLIRADLYRGQPCGQDSYSFLALIGYYECVHS